MSSTFKRSLALVAAAAITAAALGTTRVRAQAPSGGSLRWVKGAPFPEPEEELYAVTVNGKMYVIGGFGYMAQLRAKGIQSYGVGPASTQDDQLNYPAHGDVERLAESSLYPFVQYVWNVVVEVAGHK